MKKILMVIAEYFPPRLGGDRRIFELMKGLAWKYDVHFVTLPPSYTLFIRKIDPYTPKNVNQVLCEGMRGHRLGLPRPIWKLWTESFLLAFMVTEVYLFFQMLRKMALLKPDIVIVNDTSVYTGLLGFICSKVMNKKLIVDYNDLMGLYSFKLVKDRTNRFLRKILMNALVMVEDILVKHGWRVTTITAFIKNYAWTRKTRKDIVVIPNGVDTNLFDPTKVNGQKIRSKYGICNGTTLCVYAGRIEEVAGTKIMLGTAQLLKREENIKFMIVGEGNPQIINELSKLENVILTGAIPRESVPEYLAAADIVFVPFANSVASNGISPLKLFEALAMEKPVIASSISGIKEVVCKDFNVTLVSDNPECWASAVMELVKDGERTAKLSQNSREVICQKYDLNRLASVFDKVIES